MNSDGSGKPDQDKLEKGLRGNVPNRAHKPEEQRDRDALLSGKSGRVSQSQILSAQISPAQISQAQLSQAQTSRAQIAEAPAPWNLQKLVHKEVLPRLFASHDKAIRTVRLTPDFEGSAAEKTPKPAAAICDIAMASISADYQRVEALIRDRQRIGLTIDQLILGVLSQAACYLGQLWVEDKISFFETTCGTATLQHFVRALSADAARSALKALNKDPILSAQPARILLTTVPGEQHVMALAVLEHFFLQAGWDVVCEPRPAKKDLAVLVRSHKFDVIGLTLSDAQLQASTQKLVQRLKLESGYRAVKVLVGGHVFKSNPEAVCAVGADDWAEDAPQAVRKANAMRTDAAVTQVTWSASSGVDASSPKKAS